MNCRVITTTLLSFLYAGAVFGQDYAGLWVGRVALNFATEVTVPLDVDNIAIAPDPDVPTPTADQAYLRLLLHVNGAGQVSLLKEVAILNRLATTTTGSGVEVVDLDGGEPDPSVADPLRAESDIALVTDERLYGEFPPQPAARIASAVFDFGDSKATEALDAVADAIRAASLANHETNQTEAVFAAAVATVVANADVAASFDDFLTQFDAGQVDAFIANGVIAPTNYVAASNLVAASFFGDTRPLDMLAAVTATSTAQAAHNTAASFADLEDVYGRFIVGKLFGDMILEAATVAAETVTAGGDVVAVLDTNDIVNLTRTQAIQLKQTDYADTRFDDAIDVVVGAIVTEAGTASGTTDEIEVTLEQAGRTALANDVVRYSLSANAPTPDYTAFIRADDPLFDDFLESGDIAAAAAADAVAFEIANDPLRTSTSLANAAKLGAVRALQSVYSTAARVVRGDLPMEGAFGPGVGDARYLFAIAQSNETALAAADLSATIYLPANHPTNPFRHRIHPDHTTGFDVRRVIRLDFDGTAGETLATAGYGVDRITGIYREEVFGLHKPLGQDPDNDPIGLKVEGPFELNRISLIDALNAL